jgi:hypothetical protein
MVHFLFKISLLCLFIGLSSTGRAESLPIISHIGIIPAQFTGDHWNKFDAFKDVDSIAEELVLESKRFQILEHDLIKDLWATPDGRDELKSKYRLDILLNLSFVLKKDHAEVTARLLSPEMKLYLQESENWPLKAVVEGTRESVKENIRHLVYRFFNRIPVDVSITSVQDNFITLSGGIEQALHVGDNVKLVRVNIRTVHPILGTWDTFDISPVGEARIIESRSNVSVARLTSEVKSGSISVGDGVHVDGIFSRRLFVSEAKKSDTFVSPGVLIPPLQTDSPIPETVTEIGKPVEQAKPLDPGTLSPVAAPASTFSNPVEVPPSTTPTEIAPAPAQSPQPQPSRFFSSSSRPMSIPYVDLRTGHEMWNFTGKGSSESKWAIFPPLNYYGAKGVLFLAQNIATSGDVELGYGSTKKGSFTGYGLGVRAFWTANFSGLPFLESWSVGIRGALRGKSVDKESYGGYDLFQGGIFGSLSGSIPSAKKIDFELEYSLMPLSIGRIGYLGAFRRIRSAIGSEFSGQLLSGYTIKGINIGGGFHYENYNMLDDSGRETVTKRITVEAVGRLNLR